jgi:hypothetical protein
MKRIVAGLVLVLVALAVTYTAPPVESSSGWLNRFTDIVLIPTVSIVSLWRELLTVILLPLGSYFLVSSLFRGRSVRWLVIGWVGVYVVYMVVRATSGLIMLIPAFNFQNISDLPYLFLLGFWAGILLHLVSNPYSRADLYGILIGFLGLTITLLDTFFAGPDGVPLDSFLHVAVFIILLPSVTLLFTSFLGLITNGVRMVRWEMNGWPKRLQGV